MLIESKIFLFIAVVFMGIGFYTALTAAYQSDADFGEEYPQDRWKELFCKIMIFLGVICLLCSLGLFVYQILIDLKMI
ncbi:hypothetical protein C9E89_009890 [Acinetobacter sichuanensis]|uniref:Uncharacterized protein n=1 Tax=Acinetobacter sichuanensis TaxID=2136183 RepID=A0A371YQZ5_9GAMM|nr:hypothetical protein C9E89_009890 [Acinetobacter sichuanensis]